MAVMPWQTKVEAIVCTDVVLLKSLGINTAIVHGGGPQINDT
jgi:acetylglutamate kinase